MMRKNNLWMLAALLLCCLSFTACTDEMMDNAVEPGTDTPTEDLADYTVMLYTCGGSNLDNAIEADIIKAASIHVVAVISTTLSKPTSSRLPKPSRPTVRRCATWCSTNTRAKTTSVKI